MLTTRELAQRGAAIRYTEIQHEIRQLKTFLRTNLKRRGPRVMSAEARKKISLALRRRWAERHAA